MRWPHRGKVNDERRTMIQLEPIEAIEARLREAADTLCACSNHGSETGRGAEWGIVRAEPEMEPLNEGPSRTRP